MRIATIFAVSCLWIVTFPGVSRAQAGCDPSFEPAGAVSHSWTDYVRVAELAGAGYAAGRLVRRGAASVPCASDGPWRDRLAAPVNKPPTFSLVPPRSALLANTGYPRDRNDGMVWAGRGGNWVVEAGARFRWGPFSAAFAPAVAYQANTDVTLATGSVDDGRSPYAYAWGRRIDWPQRMGPDPFWTFDPGQSYVRVDRWGVALGISTENLWWGPGIRNSLLMGSSAPGFNHVFLGTSGPVDIWIGDIEAEAVWGHLEESPYFNENPDDDTRLFTGLVASLQPRWIPGLYLGGARVFYQTIPPEGLPAYEYFRFFEGFWNEFLLEKYGTTNDLTDQLATIYARWVLPESGFEVYAEWGRNDRNNAFDDFLQEPDHTQAYTLGFQKVFESDTRWIRLGGELTHLDRSITRLDRGTPTWYVHHAALQGYTHRGQLLGAWIGPGSQSQYLAADLFDEWGSAGLYLERVRYNSDAYYAQQSRYLDFQEKIFRGAPNRACNCQWDYTHDTELTAGLRGNTFWGDFMISSELAYSYRMHRNYAEDDENWMVNVSIAWYP